MKVKASLMILCRILPAVMWFSMVGTFSTALAAEGLQLIKPATLQQEKDRWIILDARPESAWREGHIPGAVSFSWEVYTRTDAQGIPYRALPPAELAAALGKLGIDEQTPVVVYGDADSSWGGEGWALWSLVWLGHQGPLRLLDGGIQAWRQAGFALSEAAAEPQATVRFQVSLQPQLDISTAELSEKRESLTLVDVRSPLEWLKGHIPGAIRIPWSDFYQGQLRSTLAPDALKKLLSDHGVDSGRPVVFYCTGGVRSAYAWMVYQLAGLSGGINYEGGMEAWEKTPHPAADR